MWCKQPALVKLLLAAGVDVHTTTNTGSTCLHVHAAHGCPASVVCLLIKAGVDLQALNSRGKTAAQVAAGCGNILIAALLTRAADGPWLL
jgi:ankyrin repeat protein